TGDWETLDRLRKDHPGKICPKPSSLEAQTLSGLSVAAAGDLIYTNYPISGFVCKNEDQPKKMCNDYRVSFVCHPPTECVGPSHHRDDPSGPGACDTTEASTEQNFYAYNPTQGFICRNKDQKSGNCRDYKVGFGCPCKY
ncbi:cartilage intermediate layer protein 2-like, partial [Stegastes partitus]|uniref:Cartilage intermediate layer protein 2-like n=1 Tax=Stegastes partitus TaxID=144197 RepID=A0A9Y4U101_9TELE